MPETLELNVKGIELETEKGQGLVQVTLGPDTEKKIRAIAAAAAMGKLRIVVGGS